MFQLVMYHEIVCFYNEKCVCYAELFLHKRYFVAYVHQACVIFSGWSVDEAPQILKLGNPSFPPSTSSINSPMLQCSMPVPHLCSNFRVIFGCDARKVEIKGTCRSSTSSMNVRSAPQPPPNLQSGNTNSFRATALGINQRRSCTAQKQRPASHGEEYISNFCHRGLEEIDIESKIWSNVLWMKSTCNCMAFPPCIWSVSWSGRFCYLSTPTLGYYTYTHPAYRRLWSCSHIASGGRRCGR